MISVKTSFDQVFCLRSVLTGQNYNSDFYRKDKIDIKDLIALKYELIFSHFGCRVEMRKVSDDVSGRQKLFCQSYNRTLGELYNVYFIIKIACNKQASHTTAVCHKLKSL